MSMPKSLGGKFGKILFIKHLSKVQEYSFYIKIQ